MRQTQKKIERGEKVTIAKLLAATSAIIISGGVKSPPVVVSALVDVLNLSDAINDQTLLISAFETAISTKQSAIDSFESAKTDYNNKYDTLVQLLATHTGWTLSDLIEYIAIDANREKGIEHKQYSGKHGLEAKKEWAEYDKSFAEYACKSGCTRTFRYPSKAINHKVIVTCANCSKTYNSCIPSRREYHNKWVSVCKQVSHTTSGLVLCNAGDGYWACHPHLHQYPGTEYRVTEPATPSSPGLYPVGASTITINGEKMVDAAPDDTVSVNLVMPSDKGYSRITWYLAGPYTDSSAGSQTSTTTSLSSDIETSASHSLTLPSDAPSGIYTFTVYISPHSSASDQNDYQYNLKIYVD